MRSVLISLALPIVLTLGAASAEAAEDAGHIKVSNGIVQIERSGQRLPERSIWTIRSEEHTSELQSQSNLVCRLLLEKKKQEPRLEAILRAMPSPEVKQPLQQLVTNNPRLARIIAIHQSASC